MTPEQERFIKQANIALGMNLVSSMITKEEKQRIQTAFINVIVELERMIEGAEQIPNLCPMGCEPGDQCPSICPNYKEEENENA